MGFDFPYTCPDIDKAIDGVKKDLGDGLYKHLNKLHEEIEYSIKNNQAITQDELNGIISDTTSDLWNDIKDYFELVRDTNRGMRYRAEKQIKILECEISDLTNEILRLNREISVLEDKIFELEKQERE